MYACLRMRRGSFPCSTCVCRKKHAPHVLVACRQHAGMQAGRHARHVIINASLRGDIFFPPSPDALSKVCKAAPVCIGRTRMHAEKVPAAHYARHGIWSRQVCAVVRGQAKARTQVLQRQQSTQVPRQKMGKCRQGVQATGSCCSQGAACPGHAH